MDEHPMATKMRTALEGWLQGKPDAANALEGLLAEDVVWHLAGPEQPIRGRDAVLDALRSDMAGLEVDGEVHDVVANDEHAIGLISVTLRRDGKQVGYRGTEIAHHRDGQITERWAMVDDFAAMADFWAD